MTMNEHGGVTNKHFVYPYPIIFCASLPVPIDHLLATAVAV